MMTKEQAAKYFIVAWVKNWNMRLYVSTVCGGESYDVRALQKVYPWLSFSVYHMIDHNVRRYIGSNCKRFNDMLWDAKDDAERLKLWTVVAAMDASDFKAKAISRSDPALRRLHEKSRAQSLGYKLDREHALRHGGHHWKICK